MRERFMNFRSSALVLAFALLLQGCSPSQDQSPFASRPEVKAADSIVQSFAPVRMATDAGRSDYVLGADKARVSIHRSALEKEFLLQANLVTQQIAPSFNGMK